MNTFPNWLDKSRPRSWKVKPKCTLIRFFIPCVKMHFLLRKIKNVFDIKEMHRTQFQPLHSASLCFQVGRKNLRSYLDRQMAKRFTKMMRKNNMEKVCKRKQKCLLYPLPWRIFRQTFNNHKIKLLYHNVIPRIYSADR